MAAASAPVDYALVTVAYNTFAQNKELIFHINRPISDYYIPSGLDAPLHIDKKLYKECLSNVTKKTHELCRYFFFDLNGKQYYINEETADAFTTKTRQGFPDLKYTRLFALVDKETDTQLISDNRIPGGYAYIGKEGEELDSKIAWKIRALIAKLIPDSEQVVST